jgi:imidazolonepropionase-like amidohydrolase
MKYLHLACACAATWVISSASAAAQPTALVGARLIDGSGKVIERGTLVIDGGRITAVGAETTTAVPGNARRVDVAGRTILPGLINAHGHVPATVGLQTAKDGYTRENLLRQLRTYAQYGVTTVFSLGDDQAAGFQLRDEQAAGALDRARIFVAGTVIGGDTPEAALAATETVLAMKPDILKIRIDDNLGAGRKMPEAAWKAVLAKAHEQKLRLAVHVVYLDDAKAAAGAGADMIAHSVRDKLVDAEFAKLMKARDACYCPTLTREISTFIYDATPPWANDPFFLKGVSADISKALADPARQAAFRNSGGYKSGQQYKAWLPNAQKNLKMLSDQGVRIAMGTDTGPPMRFQGFFEHLEIEMMVESGLTPMQAIVASTGDAARCHQKTGQLGALTTGAAADLLILTANPLDNIRNMRTIDQVWIAGRKVF